MKIISTPQDYYDAVAQGMSECVTYVGAGCACGPDYWLRVVQEREQNVRICQEPAKAAAIAEASRPEQGMMKITTLWIDMGDDAALTLEALRIGLTHLIFHGEEAVLQQLQSVADKCGAKVIASASVSEAA